MQKIGGVQQLVQAMKSAGQTDDLIVDRLISNPNLNDQVKGILKNSKIGKMQSKAVSDFLAIPVQKQEAVSAEDLKTKGALGAVAEFTGVEPLGRYLGAQAAKLDPKQGENLKYLREHGMEKEAETLSRGGVSNRELIGSAIQTVGMAALPFASKALSAGGLGTRVLSSAGVQGAFGASAEAARGGSSQNIMESGIAGAILGAGLPVAGAILRGMGNALSKYPENAYSKIFKASEKDISQLLESKAIPGRTVNPSLAKEILDKGITGTAEEMGTALSATRRAVGQELRPLADASNAMIPLKDRGHLLNVLKAIRGGYNESLVPEKVRETTKYINFITKVKPKEFTARQALDLKIFIDDARNLSSFNLNPSLSDKQAAFKSVADYFRAQLHLDPVIGKQLDAYRIATQGFNAMVKEAVKERNMALLNRLDAIALGVGAATGMPSVAAGAAGLIHMTRNPKFLTQSAQKVNQAVTGLTKQRTLGSVGENIRQGGRQLLRGTLGQF